MFAPNSHHEILMETMLTYLLESYFRILQWKRFSKFHSQFQCCSNLWWKYSIIFDTFSHTILYWNAGAFIECFVFTKVIAGLEKTHSFFLTFQTKFSVKKILKHLTNWIHHWKKVHLISTFKHHNDIDIAYMNVVGGCWLQFMLVTILSPTPHYVIRIKHAAFFKFSYFKPECPTSVLVI